MQSVSFPLAFIAGIVSFFAPCVVPLLPAYVGYVTGVSIKDLQEHGYKVYRKRILITSLLYVLGFSFVFVLLGSVAAGIGGLIRQHTLLIQRLGGLIILILGLEFAGVLKISFLTSPKRFKLPEWTQQLGYLRALFIGFIFATAWSPCVGAILGSILALAATTGMAIQGAFLLFVYSLGISIPFLLVSFTLVSAPKYLRVISRKINIFAKLSGLILIILGLLFVTGAYRYLSSYVYKFSYGIGWTKFLVDNF